MTNYDHIKSMSVDEMAQILCKSDECQKYCVFTKDGVCNDFSGNELRCVRGCRQWLLQEVNDNDR